MTSALYVGDIASDSSWYSFQLGLDPKCAAFSVVKGKKRRKSLNWLYNRMPESKIRHQKKTSISSTISNEYDRLNDHTHWRIRR